MGLTFGVMLQKWQDHSFVSDNASEGITDNWSAGLDELYSI